MGGGGFLSIEQFGQAIKGKKEARFLLKPIYCFPSIIRVRVKPIEQIHPAQFLYLGAKWRRWKEKQTSFPPMNAFQISMKNVVSER